ncbi:MAG: hypothetical protein GEU79_05490 [Acidimicrobiia bacterium]|nr:hypothetical protein [Acidimicrobiia bacterium]
MRAPTEPKPSPQINEQLLGGIVLFAIAAVFLGYSGEETMDWLFPRVLAYALVIVGVVLVIMGLLGKGRKVPLIPPLLRGHGVDVGVFAGLAAAWVILIQPVGFWIISLIVLFLGAVYLTNNRDRKSIIQAAVMAGFVVVAGYLVMLKLFYVPLRITGSWWPF